MNKKHKEIGMHKSLINDESMKTFDVSLLNINDNNSVGYIFMALKKIRKNPDLHGYSDTEVSRLLKLEKKLNESINRLEKATNSITSILKDINIGFEEYRKNFGSIISQIQNLSESGWFISPKLLKDYTLEELVDLSENSDPLITEQKIISKHGSNIEVNRTINQVLKSFPNRSIVLNEISQCYSLGLFSAAITLSYTQTDGICNEIWSFGFFDKEKKNQNKSKLYLELVNSDFGFSSHFVNQLGISDNEIIRNSKDPLFVEPKIKNKTNNRHLVIHGHSKIYGNKVNALKAILLLGFLDHFVTEFKNFKIINVSNKTF